ncbi:MAG: pyruvate kinase [Alphaproteobacteria bacterium]
MRRERSAKIIATLGPASSDIATIARLFEAGADVFRFNFSHGSHADHLARHDAVREVERLAGRPIGILVDLQGPKIRIGKMQEGGVILRAGARLRLDLDQTPGDERRAPLPHPEVFRALQPGFDLLLDDGKLRLKVIDCGHDFTETEVVVGGKLRDRKGVNVPDAILPLAALSPKDHEDLRYALTLGVDWIALSFVQRPEDVAEAKKIVAGRASVMAKLEKPAAFERLDEIVDLSDAVMVARGDLGVELPPERVPSLQKQLVRVSRKAGKPVVVATQMLESMIASPTPTRAEASDVATAVYEGADAVMLSAETASGQYPFEAVSIMNRIMVQVEKDPHYRQIMDAEHPDPQATANDAITAAAARVAHTISAKAIVTYTTSGSTTLRAARERPGVPILSLTPSISTARRLTLAWGVHGVQTADVTSIEEMVRHAGRQAIDQGFGAVGERLVITAGMPFGTPGATNLLRIAWIES